MAASADKSTPLRMPWREALKRAGSFEALLPHLLAGHILAWHAGLYRHPGGSSPESGPGDIQREWWDGAFVDPDSGRVVLKQEFAGLVLVEVFAIGIELEADAVERIFPAAAPEEPGEREEASGAGEWAAGEAKRIKDEGELPPDIKITHLAKKLEDRMRKAAKIDSSIRPVGWKYIKNKLPEWGLWPVSQIK